MPDVSTNWRRDHPWAAVYDFFVQRETLSRPLGRLLLGTDTDLITQTTAAIAEVPDGGSVLDIPCGGGLALRGLSRDQRLRYVAADIAPTMLERTAEVARQRGLQQQVETVAADVERLPFADGAFDLCISLAGLHCFPRPAAAVREIARCLAPGARFVGSVFLTDGGLRYTPALIGGRVMGVMGPSGSRAELERWLLDAGLEDVGIRRSGAMGYFGARRA
jgi:ubiquinone/menaquinone biosynthesis C-methylase UbiE